jgi:hypothetical protein
MDHGKAKMTEIMQDSVFDLIELAQTPQPGVEVTGGSYEQGKIPVVTSDLIRSLATELNGSGFGSPEQASYSAVIPQMQPGDKIRFNWTMPYAMGLEVGYTTSLGNEVGGRHWVSYNAAKWDDIVQGNVQRVAG